MVAFDGIGGVDRVTDLRGIGEEGRQIFPVIFPGADGNRIFVAPLFTQLAEISF